MSAAEARLALSNVRMYQSCTIEAARLLLEYAPHDAYMERMLVVMPLLKHKDLDGFQRLVFLDTQFGKPDDQILSVWDPATFFEVLTEAKASTKEEKEELWEFMEGVLNACPPRLRRSCCLVFFQESWQGYTWINERLIAYTQHQPDMEPDYLLHLLLRHPAKANRWMDKNPTMVPLLYSVVTKDKSDPKRPNKPQLELEHYPALVAYGSKKELEEEVGSKGISTKKKML